MLTWHYGNRLQRSQHTKGAQASQVAHLYEYGRVAGRDDNKVQPVPRVSQVRILVQQESFGDYLDNHFGSVNY